jgi:hypothetical protein
MARRLRATRLHQLMITASSATVSEVAGKAVVMDAEDARSKALLVVGRTSTRGLRRWCRWAVSCCGSRAW